MTTTVTVTVTPAADDGGGDEGSGEGGEGSGGGEFIDGRINGFSSIEAYEDDFDQRAPSLDELLDELKEEFEPSESLEEPNEPKEPGLVIASSETEDGITVIPIKSLKGKTPK